MPGLDSTLGLTDYPCVWSLCWSSTLAVAEWSQPLPRPITIPDVMKLATLGDVRVLVEKHLPPEYRAKFGWQQLTGMLRRTAEGKEDAAEFSTALQIVLKIEGVEYRTS
jgi:hypothetical protein